jgi:hypothetical protein
MKKRNVIIPVSFVILVFALSGCAKESTTSAPTRDSFLGDWSVFEPAKKQQNYEVTIYSDPNSGNGVLIENFANLKSTVKAGAVVSGSTITLDANQVIEDYTINGSGTLSGNKIIWKYTLYTGADLKTVDATYTKK